jgi:hypothetical protein
LAVCRRAHDPELLGDQYQFGQRLNLKLLHHVVAMGLDRPLGRTQFVGDLLVELAAHDQGEDLALPRREGGDEGTQGGKPFMMFLCDLMPRERALDRVEQRLFCDRLG